MHLNVHTKKEGEISRCICLYVCLCMCVRVCVCQQAVLLLVFNNNNPRGTEPNSCYLSDLIPETEKLSWFYFTYLSLLEFYIGE